MKTSDFDFHLPDELIAKYPLEKRTSSRLLVFSNEIEHKSFKDIKQNTKRSGMLQKIGNVLSLEKLEDTSEQIFNQMLKKKYKKIVVKRPIKSNPLFEKINYQVKGKAIRYDIYIKT